MKASYAILQCRSHFLDYSKTINLFVRLTNYPYVKEISKEDALEVIQKKNLKEVHRTTDGIIYADPYFKTILNINYKLRFELIKKLEE